LDSDEKITIYPRVTGLKRLSTQSFDSVVEKIRFHTCSLRDLHKTLAQSREELLSLGVLNDVQIDVDQGARPDVAEVSIFCQESRFNVDLGCNMNREGNASVDFNVKVPGVLGGLTSFTASASQAMQGNNFMAKFTNPRVFSKDLQGDIECRAANSDFSGTSCFQEHVEGVSGSVSSLSGKHTLFTEFTTRDITPTPTPERRPSNEVLNSRLRTIKSAVKYVFLSDDGVEEEEGFPSSGLVKRASVEVAGGLGDVTFVKADTTLTKYLPFNIMDKTVIVSGIFFGGLLMTPQTSSPIQDRYFMGGSYGYGCSVRGFSYRGIGPRGYPPGTHAPGHHPSYDQAGDALGGDAAIGGQLNVSVPVDFYNMRLFGFVNCASMIPGPIASRLSCLPHDLVDAARVSVGLGVAFPIMTGTQLELTVSEPVLQQGGDCKQRFQFGLRVNKSF